MVLHKLPNRFCRRPISKPAMLRSPFLRLVLLAVTVSGSPVKRVVVDTESPPVHTTLQGRFVVAELRSSYQYGETTLIAVEI